MAGTRLAVHSIFFAQLVCLVAISFIYASTRPFDPSSSPEPFISDQSGWHILVEDVSPIPSHDGNFIRDFLGEIALQVNTLLGGGDEERNIAHHNRKRNTSVFVEQMRQKISELPLASVINTDNSSGEDDPIVVLPQLKMNLHMPTLIQDAKIMERIAETLETSLQQGGSLSSPGIKITIADVSKDKVSHLKSCDEWVLPESTTRNSKQIKLPNIYLLTGCSEKSRVDLPQKSDYIVIRTTHNNKDVNGLEQYLQKEISPILLKIVYNRATTKESKHRLERMSVQLIDEDPSSRVVDSKRHFDLLSKALSSSLQSTISPMLNDLSFIYGGNIEVIDDDDFESESFYGTLLWKDAINLSASTLAYLPLPTIIEAEREVVNDDDDEVNDTTERLEDESVLNKFMSIEHMSKFIQSHSSQRSQKEELEWIMFLPSKNHSPLTLRDKTSGGNGHSIILSSESEISKRAGMSLVQIDDLSGVEPNELHDKYIHSLSQALIYLVGYIREMNGLPPSPIKSYAALSSSTTSVECLGGSTQQLSFWELESIAQSHWYPVLQQTLHEIDAAMTLLHEHGNTLALPKHVARKINKATNLLRKSITYVEEGLPTMYATSALYGALAMIEVVTADPDLFELHYFAPDHYLAVFSPLALPLMMPLIFGLVREVRRFKKLKRKKQT